MTTESSTESLQPAVLGIECGATRSVALYVQGSLCRRAEGGPANLKLLTDPQLLRHLRSLREVHTGRSDPAALAIGMAGARTASDRERIVQAAARIWPGVPCRATNDLETGLAAAEDVKSGSGKRGARPRVLVLSGTGSCCFGRSPTGRTARCGGWGHVMGDRGSGYEIGLRALRALACSIDAGTGWPRLGQRVLRNLQLNDPEELVGWAQAATKTDIAALAVEVFEAAHERDRVAAGVLADAAKSLADDALCCAGHLGRRGAPMHFVLAGSILVKQPGFADEVRRLIRRGWPGATVAPLQRESAWGAVELARLEVQGSGIEVPGSWFKVQGLPAADVLAEDDVASLHQSPTEQRNPLSMNLDKMGLDQAIEFMLREDAKIPQAILTQRKPVERALKLIVRSLRQGGRLFYVGAGTSGRLGVLDASECPPTFGTAPDTVQGIMAGGQTALWRSVEGAEDDPEAGAQAMRFRSVTDRDVVVGIAASGRTPFVWGALGEARKRRAATVLVCFNPFLRVPSRMRPTVVIAPNLGPEILTGSTRLKAGTATKLILNIFTTLTMVRIGKVVGNLMVDLNPSNVKLRDRAVRIVRELTGASEDEARSALEKAKWVVKTALTKLRR